MRKISRRNFISTTGKILGAAPLAGALGAIPGCMPPGNRPNILLLIVDQMHTPPEGYEDNEGADPDLKEVLGFKSLSANNAYAKYFKGLMRLRKNAVVMRKHYTASAACVPSRTSMMTGQYPSVTGVTQTDGNYKSAADVPWLDPEGTPTIGDWFRAAGYSTHYFGKWHVSEPEAPDYLEPWGFAGWEQSSPEPHSGTADNLGVFRDKEFTNAIVDFFSRKSAEKCDRPWLAVGSIVNPHDISAYPINWQVPNHTGVVEWEHYPPPPGIPAQGETSREGGMNEQNVIELNPDGFPQNNSALPRTYGETLDEKPRCQKDYSLKWGLSQAANANYVLNNFGLSSPQPFQLQGENAEAWSLAYNQFYFYCQYLADLQLRKVLQGLDDNGLAENTIVIFISDHGEMAGSHGGTIQKWHNAYEETVRVPWVISSPLVNGSQTKMREIQQPTSTIDLAPTLLGLAGLSETQLRKRLELSTCTDVRPLAGADVSAHAQGLATDTITGPAGNPRTGVLFMSNDMITEFVPNAPDPKPAQFKRFCDSVDALIEQGYDLAPGSVRQPNNVRAFCTGDWKLVHYVDPNGAEADEWEFYCLTEDPVEATNLVDYATGLLRTGITVTGMTQDELEAKLTQLKAELAQLEADIIGANA